VGGRRGGGQWSRGESGWDGALCGATVSGRAQGGGVRAWGVSGEGVSGKGGGVSWCVRGEGVRACQGGHVRGAWLVGGRGV